MSRWSFIVFWFLAGALGTAGSFGCPVTWAELSGMFEVSWVPLGIVAAALLLLGVGIWGDSEHSRAYGNPDVDASGANASRSSNGNAQALPRPWWQWKLALVCRSLVPAGPKHIGWAVGLAASGGFAVVLIPPVMREPNQWQQAIGAVIGFLGLAAAALLNAKFERQRDDRNDAKHADAIRQVFMAELFRLQEMERNIYDPGLDIDKENTPIEEYRRRLQEAISEWLRNLNTPIYKQYQDRLDSLSAIECKYVLEFYNFLEKARRSVNECKQNIKTLDKQNYTEQENRKALNELYNEILTSSIFDRAKETRNKIEENGREIVPMTTQYAMDVFPNPNQKGESATSEQ
ncbi:hypothetical protein [Limimonas halophila]|nr:hypothetical protein [Limimonas halophila]